MQNRPLVAHQISAFVLIALTLLIGLACTGKDSRTSDVERDPVPLRLYVVSDVHVGNTDAGDNFRAFVRMVNSNTPDLVLDLGDTFQAEITEYYPFDTHEEAAWQQHRDWLAAWNSIEIEHKAVALGNRDVQTITRTDRFTLTEEDWITNLGYENKPPKGGSKLQESFIVEGEDVKALVFVLGTYIASFSMEETMNWVRDEVTDFDGDFIVFANHNVGVYEHLKTVLIDHNVTTPAIFLHGHNHGPDTLVRDAWGLEQDDFDFPCYMVSDLMENGIGAKFELYPGGRYEKFRLDVKNNTISEPVMHYQTRVEQEQI